MPKFKKPIVSPGVHKVHRLDGKEDLDPITPQRIKLWAENTNKLIELGAQIPAPFAHQDAEGNFPFPLLLGDDGASVTDAYMANGQPQKAWDNSINSGFWEKYEVDDEGRLIGVLDSPGEEDDDKTPAGKIGKTFRETSVLVRPKCTFRAKDGSIHEIGEHLAHAAVCLNGQEKGQDNFTSLKEDNPLAMGMILAMSDVISDSKLPDPAKPRDELLTTVLSLLRSPPVTVDLPDSTTRENFLESLSMALRQKVADQQASQSQEAGVGVRPPGAATKTPSIAMSELKTKTAEAPTAADKTLALAMGQIIKTRKAGLEERIAKLQATGRIKAEYADKLRERLGSFSMSADDLTDDGGFPVTPIEELIEGLEQAAPLAGDSVTGEGGEGTGDLPQGASVEHVPLDIVSGEGVDDVSESVADEIFEHAGI